MSVKPRTYVVGCFLNIATSKFPSFATTEPATIRDTLRRVILKDNPILLREAEDNLDRIFGEKELDISQPHVILSGPHGLQLHIFEAGGAADWL